MKRYIFLLVLFSNCFASPLFSQWEECNSGLWGGSVHEIFEHKGKIFACTDFGIYFSTNKGLLWEQTKNILTYKNIKKISSNNEIIIASTDYNIFTSTDSGSNWTNLNFLNSSNIDFCISGDSVFVSTLDSVYFSEDSCKTWKNLGFNVEKFLRFIAVSSNKSLVITNSHSVFYSPDIGQNWFDITNGLPPSDSGSFFITSLRIDCNTIYISTSKGLYKTCDFGNNWILLTKGNRGDYVSFIEIYDSNIFYFYKGLIYFSTNHGDNWLSMNIPPINKTSILKLFISDNDIIIGTRGNGMFKSTDWGISWKEINYGLTCSFINSLFPIKGRVFACTGNGLFKTGNYGTEWIENLNGFPEFININEILNFKDKLYASTSQGIYISTDNGFNWILQKNRLSNGFVSQISSFENYLIALASDSLFLSIDDGLTWTPIFEDSNDDLFKFTISGNNIIVSIFNSDSLVLSSDLGKTWRKIFLELHATVYSLFSIDNVVYACTIIDLFRSTDNGITWSIAEKFAFPIAFSLISKNTISLSNDRGFKISTNKGFDWDYHFYDQFDGKHINSVALSDDYLIVGTYGGAYRAKLSNLGITDVEEMKTPEENELLIYPNPAGEYIEIRKPSEGWQPSEGSHIRIYNILGECVMETAIYPITASHRMNIEYLPPGIYTLRCGSQAKMFVKE